MPPKKNQDSPTITTEQIEELLANQRSMMERLEAVEQLLTASRAENAALKQANCELSKVIADKSIIIDSLLHKHNNLEQYNRSWSVRLAGINIPPEESTNPSLVMRHVYDKALLPILQGALNRGLLQAIPHCEQLLETAHILPGNDSKPRPIIARFYSRNMRAMMFQLKKEFATKVASPSDSHSRSPRLKYPFYEDLTKTNFKMLKALADDSRTGAVWSIGGVIRYKMANSSEVKKVVNVFAEIDDFLT
jgi:hypothetical protein